MRGVTAASYSGILLMITLSYNILNLSTLMERSREEQELDSITYQMNACWAAFDRSEADDNSFYTESLQMSTEMINVAILNGARRKH